MDERLKQYTDRMDDLKNKIMINDVTHGINKPVEFLIKFFFDIFLVFVFYIYQTLKSAYSDIKLFYDKKEWRKMSLTISIYILDLFLPTSIILLTKTVVVGIFATSSRDIYFEWETQCYVFFISCISLQSYLYTFIMKAPEEFTLSMSYFMSADRLYSLGLGRIKGSLLSEKVKVANFILNLQSVASKDKIHRTSTFEIVDDNKIFHESIILPITVSLNIEPYFMHFRLIDDEEVMEKEDVSALSQAEEKAVVVKSLFYSGGHSLSDDLLMLLYKKADDAFQGESPQRYLAIGSYLILKVGIPFFYVILNNTTTLKLGSLLVILGFYIYIVSFIFLISDNEDLKRRTFINSHLSKFISFNNKDKKNQKFDITCIISLHCWNDARRISLVMDKDKTEKYEVSYVFLGVYLIFLLIILAQIFLDIHWFVGKTSFFRSHLILMNMTIDCLLLTSIFINRIYHGDKFNHSFIDQKDAVQDLLEAVTSLQNMRSFFFDKEFKQHLQNNYFSTIVRKVDQKIHFKQKGKEITVTEFDHQRKEFISLLVVQVALMKKQCLYDMDIQKHRFLGLFESDFTALMQTLFIGFLSVAPTLMGSIASNV